MSKCPTYCCIWLPEDLAHLMCRIACGLDITVDSLIEQVMQLALEEYKAELDAGEADFRSLIGGDVDAES